MLDGNDLSNLVDRSRLGMGLKTWIGSRLGYFLMLRTPLIKNIAFASSSQSEAAKWVRRQSRGCILASDCRSLLSYHKFRLPSFTSGLQTAVRLNGM